MMISKIIIDKYKYNSRPWNIGLGAVVILAVILFGFDKRLAVLNQCKAVVTKYVTAEYEEDTIDTCWDTDGNTYICYGTDYWSEPASAVNTVITVNGEFYYSSGGFTPKQGANAWYPPMPNQWNAMRGTRYFDRFKTHTSSKLHLFVEETISGEASSISQSVSKSPRCLERLDKKIIVSTWYNITYSSNL